MSESINVEEYSSTGKRKSELSNPAKRRKSNSDTEEDDCLVVQKEIECSCGLKELVAKKEAQIKELTRQLDKEKAKYEEYITTATKKQLKNNLTILKQKDEIDKLLKDNEELMTLVKELTDKNNTLNGKIAALELRPEAERLAKRAIEAERREASDSSDDDDPRSKKKETQPEIPPNTDILRPQLLHKLANNSNQTNLLQAVTVKTEVLESPEENILPSDFMEFDGNNDSEPEVTTVKAGNMKLRPRGVRVCIKEEPLSDEDEDDEATDSSTPVSRVAKETRVTKEASVTKETSNQGDTSKSVRPSASVASGSSTTATSAGNGNAPLKTYSCSKRTHSCIRLDNFGPHNKNRPCLPELCDFVSSDLNVFISHQIKKHGAKPFKCYACDFITAYHSVLIQHEEKHMDFMPYKCEKCKTSYKTEHNLSSHMRRFHSQVYKCDECNYKTDYERCYKAHKRNHDLRRLRQSDSDSSDY